MLSAAPPRRAPVGAGAAAPDVAARARVGVDLLYAAAEAAQVGVPVDRCAAASVDETTKRGGSSALSGVTPPTLVCRQALMRNAPWTLHTVPEVSFTAAGQGRGAGAWARKELPDVRSQTCARDRSSS